MSDVFISYARSTAKQAQAVAEALRGLGYSVWRDDELPAHRAYAEVIEERLQMAKAVVVIWSAEAVKSEWVQSEADTARTDHKLVQLTVDGSKLPRPFDRIQCADLAGWTGDLNAPGWRKVVASIAELTGTAGGSASNRPEVVSAAEPAEPLLAVLAFDNLSGDPEMAYFSDGVSEEIQETVARGADLKVIGRASSFQFRGADKAAAHVGAELGATHVLDGSVRRSGARVRISAQLVECGKATTVWSERFDRELDDVFALQDEIAEAVAAALKTAFARAGPAPGKLDPAAYDLLLRARDQSAFRPVPERIELLEQCVALAPDFALGWAWLAFYRAEQIRFYRGDLALGPLVEAARVAVASAERLDPTLGFTRAVRSSLEPFAAYQAREALLSEALRLTPGDAYCLGLMSSLLGEVGRCRASLALADEAKKRDPLLPSTVSRWLIMLDERYDEQAAGHDAARAKWPGNIEFSLTAATNAAANRDWPRYDALVQHAYAQPFAEDPRMGRVMRETFRFLDAIRDGDQAFLDGLADRLMPHVERTGTVGLDALWSSASTGHVEAAFQAVERATFDGAFEVGGQYVTTGWWSGTLFLRRWSKALIDDPRFPRLCAKLGLVHYWIETDRWPDCADQVSYDFRAEARKAAAEGLARRA